MSLARNCQRRWFLQMRRQIVRLMCSYQQAIDAPNAIGGQILRGATFLITYCLGSTSAAGTGWYGFAIYTCTSVKLQKIYLTYKCYLRMCTIQLRIIHESIFAPNTSSFFLYGASELFILIINVFKI